MIFFRSSQPNGCQGSNPSYSPAWDPSLAITGSIHVTTVKDLLKSLGLCANESLDSPHVDNGILISASSPDRCTMRACASTRSRQPLGHSAAGLSCVLRPHRPAAEPTPRHTAGLTHRWQQPRFTASQPGCTGVGQNLLPFSSFSCTG